MNTDSHQRRWMDRAKESVRDWDSFVYLFCSDSECDKRRKGDNNKRSNYLTLFRTMCANRVCVSSVHLWNTQIERSMVLSHGSHNFDEQIQLRLSALASKIEHEICNWIKYAGFNDFGKIGNSPVDIGHLLHRTLVWKKSKWISCSSIYSFNYRSMLSSIDSPHT